MYVYILKCSDNTYYTGVTNNLEKRFQEHEQVLIEIVTHIQEDL